MTRVHTVHNDLSFKMALPMRKCFGKRIDVYFMVLKQRLFSITVSMLQSQDSEISM